MGNICMYCGRESKERFEFRVLDEEDMHRDFCEVTCLVLYYEIHLEQMLNESSHNNTN